MMMFFIWITVPYQIRVLKKLKLEASTCAKAVITILIATWNGWRELDKKEVETVEESLSLLEDSCYTIRAILEKTNSKMVELTKLSKVCLSYFSASIRILLTLARMFHIQVGQTFFFYFNMTRAQSLIKALIDIYKNPVDFAKIIEI